MVRVHTSIRELCNVYSRTDNVFVLLEDPGAPTRADILQQAADNAQSVEASLADPGHYRNTFLTLSPPGALEQLLAQLKARWISVRESNAPSSSQKSQGGGQQLVIDGDIYAIGNDWLVRAGNVILSGGAVKGMLLEVGHRWNLRVREILIPSIQAEYLPLPVMRSLTSSDGTSALLENLLTSVLPNIADAKTAAVIISDQQWEEVLWDREDEQTVSTENVQQDEDDVYASQDELPEAGKDDWTGVSRDRRSAYLIIGALRSEGML